jgi:DNA-binding IclR family transcriptional regulator
VNTVSATSGKVKSADRAMAVLDLLAERTSLVFAEIAEALELPKSSAHSLLQTMTARGYLALDNGRRYRLGIHVWELAQRISQIDDLRTLLTPVMDEVVERTGETVQLATLDGVSAVYVAVSESPHPMKLTSRAGSRLPAHTSAIGKVLLASLEPEEAVRRLDSAELTKLTEHTTSSPRTLIDELERIRERGYATDNEEFAIGLRCVAVPIRDLQGETVAAVSVSMPTPRYSRTSAREARAALTRAADKAAPMLGRWRT